MGRALYLMQFLLVQSFTVSLKQTVKWLKSNFTMSGIPPFHCSIALTAAHVQSQRAEQTICQLRARIKS